MPGNMFGTHGRVSAWIHHVDENLIRKSIFVDFRHAAVQGTMHFRDELTGSIRAESIIAAFIDERHAFRCIVGLEFTDELFIPLVPGAGIARMLLMPRMITLAAVGHGQLIQIHAVGSDFVRQIMHRIEK